MLLDEIKQRMFTAMKAGNTVEKEILRVAVGEITTSEGRNNAALSDDEVRTILRKLVKSNREALAAAPSDEAKAALEQEIGVLETLLPQNLTVPQIVEALSAVHEQIKAAPNAGPAMGLAMKTLKAQNATVESKDVTDAINTIRG
jgi:uncharacterized protein YqeY